MKTLHLNLKKKWFDLILSGEKKEEYIKIKEYWIKKFVTEVLLRSKHWMPFGSIFSGISHDIKLLNEPNKHLRFTNDYKTITFSNGYSKKRKFEIEFKHLEISTGKIEWGAERGEKYFVLRLGEIISTKKS